jgi:hypothetical protein
MRAVSVVASRGRSVTATLIVPSAAGCNVLPGYATGWHHWRNLPPWENYPGPRLDRRMARSIFGWTDAMRVAAWAVMEQCELTVGERVRRA